MDPRHRDVVYLPLKKRFRPWKVPHDNPSNRFRQRNLFRTCFHTILGVATVIHAADPKIPSIRSSWRIFPGGMLIEEQGPIDGWGPMNASSQSDGDSSLLNCRTCPKQQPQLMHVDIVCAFAGVQGIKRTRPKSYVPSIIPKLSLV